MSTLLTITVGGSCAPIVSAIEAYAPEYVYFIVTGGPRGSAEKVTGDGNPCGDPRMARCPECDTRFPLGDPQGANILAQTGLPDTAWDKLVLEEPDAFSACYMQLHAALGRLAEAHPQWRLIADYTGGTKTMTAALTAVALELGWELSLVQGARLDLVKVRNGTECASLVNAAEVRARRQLVEARRLFEVYAYASAMELLGGALRAAPLSPPVQREIQGWVTLCRAFYAWDLFDHQRARQLLEPYQSRCVPQWIFLKRLTGPQPGYALVWDLLRNAERRASRGRYDDAVARLYRALELLAQTRLQTREPALESGHLDLAALPEALRERYAQRRDPTDGRIKLGLREDYELLLALEDPLGMVYQDYQQRLLNILQPRNASILAHGMSPITREQWQATWEMFTALLDAGLAALKVRVEAPQFPTWQEAAPREADA